MEFIEATQPHGQQWLEFLGKRYKNAQNIFIAYNSIYLDFWGIILSVIGTYFPHQKAADGRWRPG